MPGDLVPTLALWTATTFRQQKGSPLRALPTTPPCRVHPCSRLFHRPPVSPRALPALPGLNSPAWHEVPRYPSTPVPPYPSTGAWSSALFPSTQLMCVYFFSVALFPVHLVLPSPPTSLLIHSAARYSGCRRREGQARARPLPPDLPFFLQRSREEWMCRGRWGRPDYSRQIFDWLE